MKLLTRCAPSPEKHSAQGCLLQQLGCSCRGGGDTKSREWTQHLTEMMGAALADAARTTTPAAPAPAEPQHSAPLDEPNDTSGEHCGWIQIDIAPLIGRSVDLLPSSQEAMCRLHLRIIVAGV